MHTLKVQVTEIKHFRQLLQIDNLVSWVLQAIYLHKTKVLYHVDIKNGVIAKILQLNQYQDNKESKSKL